MKTSLVLVLCLALLVASIEAGRRNGKKDKDKDRKRKKGGKCEQITTSLCTTGNLPYNNTRLPNLLGHTRMDDIEAKLAEYMPLFKVGCSPYIGHFLCSTYLPECPRKKKMKILPPCRELCVKAKEGCEDALLNVLGMDWPSELSCDDFPSRDEGSKKKENKEKKKKKKNKNGCFYYEPVLPTRMATPPRIEEEPESTILQIGETIKLRCAAAYEEGLKYSWRKIEGPIPEDRSEIDTNELRSILRIEDTRANDAGTYICKVSKRDGGSTEVSAIVGVAAPPTAARIPEDTVTTVGSSVTLHCEVNGHPEPEIIWSRDVGDGITRVLDSQRTSVEDGMLSIMNAQLGDTGAYYCIAGNRAGFANVTFILHVYEMPQFLETPEDATAAAGGEVAFHCRVDGLPMPTITWAKSSGVLPVNRVNITDDGTLYLRDIQNTDVDIYTCTAVNFVGAISATAQLEVQVKPTILTIAPHRFVAEVGEDALFMCQFSGHPRPVVFWYKNGTEKLMSAEDALGRFQVTDEGTMLIASVTEEDEGAYVCQAKNAAGMAESMSQLEVIPAGTKSTRELPDEFLTAMAGENVTLPCNAIGDSRAMVEWSLNGSTIYPADRGFEIDQNGALVLRHINDTLKGDYRCTASHVWGARFNTFTLTVMGPTTEKPATTRQTTTMATTQAMVTSHQPTDRQTAAMTTKMEEEEDASASPAMSEFEMTTQMPEKPPMCQPCLSMGAVKARRYDITNPGLEGYFRGWVDVQGQGAANDYCRIVAAGDSGFQLSCALAGTAGESEHNYQSTPDLDVGFEGTWYMKDEDGDNRDDYCRCVGESDSIYVWCMKAGSEGFFGKDENDASSGSQYSFKAPGKKRDLKRCENRIVDPFFGIGDI